VIGDKRDSLNFKKLHDQLRRNSIFSFIIKRSVSNMSVKSDLRRNAEILRGYRVPRDRWQHATEQFAKETTRDLSTSRECMAIACMAETNDPSLAGQNTRIDVSIFLNRAYEIGPHRNTNNPKEADIVFSEDHWRVVWKQFLSTGFLSIVCESKHGLEEFCFRRIDEVGPKKADPKGPSNGAAEFWFWHLNRGSKPASRPPHAKFPKTTAASPDGKSPEKATPQTPVTLDATSDKRLPTETQLSSDTKAAITASADEKSPEKGSSQIPMTWASNKSLSAETKLSSDTTVGTTDSTGKEMKTTEFDTLAHTQFLIQELASTATRVEAATAHRELNEIKPKSILKGRRKRSDSENDAASVAVDNISAPLTRSTSRSKKNKRAKTNIEDHPTIPLAVDSSSL
jgi:hypothetical protein